MRRRQIYQAKEREMSIRVPNSNLISDTAPEALKEKAKMFLPYESDIKTPGESLKRIPRSKVGEGVRRGKSR